MKRRLLLLSVVIAARSTTAGAAQDSVGTTVDAAADELLEKARARYAELQSYADSGVVVSEFGSDAKNPSSERHTFKTYYRAPRHFYFEFNEDPKAGGDRSVIWSDDEAFHAWWATTGVQSDYPRGQGAMAFLTAAATTFNSALQIAPLLFAGAGLRGPLVNLGETRLAGTEDAGGRRSHKLVGVARSAYAATGYEHQRPTTVWIDASSLLFTKIVEDTPPGTVAGHVSRLTTTFEARANPELDDAVFKFVPPAPATTAGP